jgi:hypothetical protein
MSTFLNFLQNLIQGAVTNILIPVVLGIIPVLLVKGKTYIKAIIESFISKHQSDSMSSLSGVVSAAMNQLDILVSSAVASNMSFAEKYKELASDGKLTEEEQNELKGYAKKLVYDTLPPCIKDGSILEALGGQDALDKLISGMIERALVDIKAKSVKTIKATELAPITEAATTTEVTDDKAEKPAATVDPAVEKAQ